MLPTFLCSLVLLNIADARVMLLSGEARSGAVTAISATELTLGGTPADAAIPLTDVLSIEFTPAESGASTGTQLLLLHDGSKLSVSATARNAKQTSGVSEWLGELSIANTDVRAVRLQAVNENFVAQWNGFVERQTGKDLLIVAKRDGTGLDFLAGVVSSITAEQIEFLLDGDTIPVPAARAYGIVFGQSATAEARAIAAVRLVGANGDVVTARQLSMADGTLSVESGWQQALTLPMATLKRIDLSGSRIAWLSELATIDERFDGVDADGSLLSGLIDRDQQLALFGPRRNMTIERQPGLRLKGREFERGLCIHSRTEMSWALDRKYSSLECLAGIDDEVAYNGRHAVLLRISGDDRVLFEQSIATTDEPLPISVSLDGVSTLKVLVDFGDGDSVCDWLDLADAKLIIAKEQR